MEIPKMYINAIRHSLKEIINANKDYLDTLSMYYQDCVKSFMDIEGLALKKLAIERLNDRYNTSFTLLTSKKEIESWYREKYKIGINDNERMMTILNSLSKNGFMKPCFNFPRVLMSLMINEPAYQYFIITGIKVNATKPKEPEILFDKTEKSLLDLEKKMAVLIEEDYTIKKDNGSKFLELYKEYLLVFTRFISETFGNNYKVSLETRIDMNLKNMENYIAIERNSVKEDEKELLNVSNKTVMVSISKVNPLQDYMVNGKVVKVCDIEEFTKILDSLNISEIQKQEYLAQMINLTNRLAIEEKQKRIEQIKQEAFTQEEIDTYNKAKISGNIEATQIVKDIDAIFDLYLEASEEEKGELIVEVKILIEYLQSILGIDYAQEDDLTKQVLYFKNDNLVPFIEENLINVNNNGINIIIQDLTKILDGKTTKNKELQGDLPLRVFFKGRKFKIFYSIINGIPLIIYGGSGKNVCQKVIDLVNSRAFLEYLKEVQVEIKNGTIMNDNLYTDIIMNKLKNNRGLN